MFGMNILSCQRPWTSNHDGADLEWFQIWLCADAPRMGKSQKPGWPTTPNDPSISCPGHSVFLLAGSFVIAIIAICILLT